MGKGAGWWGQWWLLWGAGRSVTAGGFMNSVLQVLLHAPPLRNYFLGDRHNRFLCPRRTPVRHKRKGTRAEEEENGPKVIGWHSRGWVAFRNG